MFEFTEKKVKLNNFEVRVIINALNDSRTKLIVHNEDPEYVDTVLLK